MLSWLLFPPRSCYSRNDTRYPAALAVTMHLSHEKRATRIVMEVILILDCGARRNFIPISRYSQYNSKKPQYRTHTSSIGITRYYWSLRYDLESEKMLLLKKMKKIFLPIRNIYSTESWNVINETDEAIRQINLKIYLERIHFVVITRCWKNSSRYLNRSRNDQRFIS